LSALLSPGGVLVCSSRGASGSGRAPISVFPAFPVMDDKIASPVPAPFTVGAWRVRPLEGVLECDGERRHLRPKSMDVLVLLAARPASTVLREEFLRQVWDGQFVDEASLARCVAEIRAALGDDAREPRYVETVPRRGYRLIAPVGNDGVAATPVPAAGSPEASSTAPEARPRQFRAVALVALAAIGVSAGWWHFARGRDAGRAAAAADSRPAVAILAVRNLSENGAGDWLQPALEQMLATELAASDLGRAMPSDVARLATYELSIAPDEIARPETLRRLGSALGAAYLVTGSYLGGAEANREALRIDLLLHDGANGEVIEGIVETGSIDDLSALVLSAGRRLRGRLGFGDGPANRAAGGREGIPAPPEAARLYFQAVVELRRGDAESARGLLERAIEIDPGSPFAHLTLAEAWAALGYDARAAASAARALALSAPLPAEGRLWTEARAYSLTPDWPAAVERLEALWLLTPDNLEYGLALADAQTHRGDFAAALAIVEDLQRRASFQGIAGRIALVEARAAAGRGDNALAADAARRARSAAERVDAPLVQGRAFELEAGALYDLGEVDGAGLALTRAFEIFDLAGQRREAASARVTLAGWRAEQGKYDEASRLAEAAIAVFQATGDRRSEALALRRVAGQRWRNGSPEKGKAALLRSIELSREIGDRAGEATSLGELAISYASFGGGSVSEPRELFEEALAIYRELDKRDGIASALNNLGKVALYQGDMRLAIERLEEAETLYGELRMPEGRGTAQFNLGYAYLEAAEVARAEAALRGAARIFDEVDNGRMVAASLDGVSRALLARGEVEEARRLLARAGELRAEMGDPGRIIQGDLGEAHLLLAEGDPRRALEVSRRAHDEVKRLPGAGSPGLRNSAEDTIAAIQLELGRPDLARAALPWADVLDSERELSINACNRWLLAARALGGLGDAAEARRLLDGVRDFAAPRGLDRLRLESELVRAELELADPGSGPELAELEAELRERGLVLLADRARAARPPSAP